MPKRELTAAEIAKVEELVQLWQMDENQERLKFFANIIDHLLRESKALAKLAHSFRWRLKSVESLRDKLARQLIRDIDERHVDFHINRENFFLEVNDLVGYRVLHLHTRQMRDIDQTIRVLLGEAQFNLLEGYPRAKVWDDESRDYFKEIGITTEAQPRMYSSVHYVIASNSSFKLTGEIQVRTLAQELWGEVDHKLNYPDAHPSISCREQIRSLAWVANSCTRLVDSIFATHAAELARAGEAATEPDRDGGDPDAALPAPEPKQ